MPSHTPEEVARRLAENRTTGGNQTTSKLRGAFQAARKKVRGGLNVAGQFTKAAVQEVSGGLREFGRGLTGREATPAGGGPGPAAGVDKATRAQQVAARLQGRTVGSGVAQGGTAGIEVTQDRPPTRGTGGTGAVGRAGGALRATGRALGPVGLAAGQASDIATSSIGSLGARFLKTNPITAPVANIAEKGLRLARGESPLEAAVETGAGGLAAATGIGALRDLAPGVQESPLNITGDTASRTPIELATGTGTPTAPAAPQGPQFGEEGERLFTNQDIGGGAANRGLRSVEENQAVADRLEAKGIAERQAGLRAETGGAPGAPGAPGGRQSSDLLNRLGAQAAGGGLASAFGALNVGGNVLRREAADRTRANEASVARTDASNKINLELTKIGAQSVADRSKNATKDAVGLTESVNKAIESGDPEQVANIRSSIFQSFESDPTNPSTRAAMSNLIAEDIRDNTESGFFGALFNPFGAGRGPLDLLKSGGQGGFNNDFQDALNKVVHNTSTGVIEIANPDGSGERQFLANMNDLQPETRQALLAFGLQTEGAGQPVTRGQGLREDPNVPAGT